MKQLNNEQLRGVTRDLSGSPFVVQWLLDSREENRILLEGCRPEAVLKLQGENNSINQILDKVPKEE